MIDDCTHAKIHTERFFGLKSSGLQTRSRWPRCLSRGFQLLAGTIGVLVLQSGVLAETKPDESVGINLFQQHLREILSHRCLSCHGGDSKESDFDLSTRESLLLGGTRGPAIVPGDATASLLYKLAARLEEPHMPEEGEALSVEELRWLATWIDAGSPFDKPLLDPDADRGPWTLRKAVPEANSWWSFQPLTNPSIPAPLDPLHWCRNPIDHFILELLTRSGLAPSQEAAPHILLRRSTLDLTGLPPSLQEVSALNANSTDLVFERWVDSLLERPGYGERWARHWLDLSRFAESHGYEQDYDRPHAFHYRDFVIRAFNDDLPFNTFVQWQLAGDELAPENVEAMKATGFLAAGAFPTQLTEKEFESARYNELDDMLSTVGTSMLGITIGCARCHDHKFDPIPQADYYTMLSTFTSTIRSNVDMQVNSKSHAEAMVAWQTKVDAAQSRLTSYESNELPIRAKAFFSSATPLSDSVSEPVWQIPEIISATSHAQATLTPLSDGSLLAGGTLADKDSYTIVVDSPLESIAGIRLEAMSDPSLPRGGPGRVAHGNFALSTISVSAQSLAEIQKVTALGASAVSSSVLVLIHPRADFSQSPELDIAMVLDNNATSAWAIDPKVGQSHAAAFDCEKVFKSPGGVRLTVTLEFNNNTQHSIGRPRIALTSISGQSLDAPSEFSRDSRRKLLASIDPVSRTAAEQSELEGLFRWIDKDWIAITTAFATLQNSPPAPELIKVLVASENVKPIPHHADGRGFPHFYPETFFLRRGDATQKQGIAPQAFLQALVSHPDGSAHWQQSPKETATSGRRAAMARWLTDTESGAGVTVARVIVNRLWQHHFGTGLVATPSDFGKTGDPPSHPELLDYLAGELIRGDWKLKPIHRLIMTSATYRQSSDMDKTKNAVDPENRLLWRANRRRLEAEAIRDVLLSLAGTLDPSLYGSAGMNDASSRRSIYLMIKRSRLSPFLRTFDSPDGISGIARRSLTTTAPQALTIMNSTTVRSWAERFATRIEAADGDPLLSAYRIAVSRPPSQAEFRDAQLFLDLQQATYLAAGHADAAHQALSDFSQVLMGLNETLSIE